MLAWLVIKQWIIEAHYQRYLWWVHNQTRAGNCPYRRGLEEGCRLHSIKNQTNQQSKQIIRNLSCQDIPLSRDTLAWELVSADWLVPSRCSPVVGATPPFVQTQKGNKYFTCKPPADFSVFHPQPVLIFTLSQRSRAGKSWKQMALWGTEWEPEQLGCRTAKAAVLPIPPCCLWLLHKHHAKLTLLSKPRGVSFPCRIQFLLHLLPGQTSFLPTSHC